MKAVTPRRQSQQKAIVFFSFLWFCWFPLTLISDIGALFALVQGTSPLTYPIWAQTVAIALMFAVVYGAIWHRGLYLDARSRNPFQQGHIGKALLKQR